MDQPLCIIDGKRKIVATGAWDLLKDPRRNLVSMQLMHVACADAVRRTLGLAAHSA